MVTVRVNETICFVLLAERCESKATAGDARVTDRRRIPILPRAVSYERFR